MFFKYKVTYYDSYREDEFPSEGLVWGESYGEAANRIVEDYGKDNIIDLYLYEIVIDGSYCVDKDDIEYAFKEH